MIDVSEIVVDPDFVQPFTYIRRQMVWNNGRKSVDETEYTATGTIIADDSRNMEIQPGGALITGAIRLWTHEQLYTTSRQEDDNYLADLVVYKGQRYIVHNDRNLNEYGYNRYNCTVEPAE